MRSAIWAVSGQVLSYGLRLGSSIVLARLLFPEAFGLMAVVGVFTYGLQMFSDLGIGPSIVQSERGDEPDFLNTAWTMQIIRGGVISAAALALCGPVASFYGEPSLRALLAFGALGPAIQGFDSIVLHTQQRKLALGPVVRLELLTQITQTTVTVGLAVVHPSVWALIWGGLIGVLTRMVLSHVYLPRFKHRLRWDPDAVRGVFRFGIWIFLSSALTFCAVQGDRLLLGHYLGLAMLGIYTVAIRFIEALEGVQMRLTYSVLFPLLSETARSERATLADRYYRVRRLMDMLFLPISALLMTFGSALVDLLYDERYAEAGWMLQVLAVHAAMSLVLSSQETLLFSIGRTYYGFARSLVKAIWIGVGIPISWTFFGVHGVVWCVALSEVPVLVVIWSGMIKNELLRPVYELRALVIWGCGVLLGLALRALL